ncbi:uncharacterized protein [Amphiura filiformis]|uniref:uncharacterized protein n=1 Tax=Amphiura filiformis TaxID=82378 RepID=UPI003B2265C2
MLAKVPPHLMGETNTAIDKMDLEKFNANCIAVGRYILQHNFAEIALQISKSLLRKLQTRNIDKQSIAQCQFNLGKLYGNLFGRFTSEPNVDFCRSICTEAFLDTMKQWLLYLDDPTNNVPNISIDGINLTLRAKLSILSTLLNIISQCPDKRNTYRNANIIKTLSQIGKTSTEMNMLSVLILSYVIDEEENKMLTRSENSTRFLTELFIKAVYSAQHILNEADLGDSNVMFLYTASELLNGLNHLAVNDSNKLEILNNGGVPAIIRMLQSDFSEEERKLATEALWNLAFVDKIRTNREVQKTRSTLKQLARSENKLVRDSSSYALWEISGNQEGISQPTDSPPSYEETVKTDSESTHLMLSYQWGSQNTVLAIRGTLTRAGYKVWMDVDDMSGDTLEAMAKAVEKSSAIIMCITEKYKESQSCRSEASYAMKKKKPIVPLLLEAGYEPDGWLGLVLGTKLYFRFCSDDEMTTGMQNVIKEIETRGLSRQSDEADGAAGVIPKQASIQQTSPSRLPIKQSNKTTKDVSTWTKEDVQDWLKEKELPELCSPLSFCTGAHLMEMYEQYQESKQEFKKDIKSEYNMGRSTLIKFITALTELFK